jgi:hypothetical protein
LFIGLRCHWFLWQCDYILSASVVDHVNKISESVYWMNERQLLNVLFSVLKAHAWLIRWQDDVVDEQGSAICDLTLVLKQHLLFLRTFGIGCHFWSAAIE